MTSYLVCETPALSTEFVGKKRKTPLVGAAGPKFETIHQFEHIFRHYYDIFGEIVVKAGVSDNFQEAKVWPQFSKAWPIHMGGQSWELQSKLYMEDEWLEFLEAAV